MKARLRFRCFRALVLIALLMLPLQAWSQSVIYVRADAGGSNDGTSWANAYADLQAALTAASAPSEIWVAGGTYRPTSVPSDRDATFQLRSGVAIYGGFAGTETRRNQRNWHTNPTILCGDINNDNALSGNSLTVVTGSGTNSTAILDGFIVTGGNANLLGGTSPASLGGGMFNDSGSPTLINIRFVGNFARAGGSGVHNQASSNPTFFNVVLSGNRWLLNGSAIFNRDSNPILNNVTISGNQGTEQISAGGGIFNIDSSPTIRNTLMWNNNAPNFPPPVINFGNSIPQFSFSLIQACNPLGVWLVNCGTDFLNNIADADPMFVNPLNPLDAPSAGGNLRLRPGSPAVDRGDFRINPFPDLAGNERRLGSTVDVGAFETPATTCPAEGGIVYVSPASELPGNGQGWGSAFRDLQDALRVTEPCEIWVAAGRYTPSSDPSDRNATLRLNNEVALYGGFAGIEAARDQRDWMANRTILSGDINGSGTLSGNSYTVVTGSGTDNTAILDGFTVTAGNADAVGFVGATVRGGGMYSDGGSPVIRNVIFSGNSATAFGGGMHNERQSQPRLTDVAFLSNTAAFGGGLDNEGSSPVLTNVVFSANSGVEAGGGINNFRSNPELVNAVFSGNVAGLGGGMHNEESSPRVINASFSGNRAAIGGGMYNMSDSQLNSSSPIIGNSIFWNNESGAGQPLSAASIWNQGSNSNPMVRSSLVQGCNPTGIWTSGCGNFGGSNTNLADVDPLFIAPVNPSDSPTVSGNLRLRPGSLAQDAGDSALVKGMLTDLDGNPRITGPSVDLGPYEISGELVFSNGFE
ncbi:MAG: hypothetical protein MEQ07_10035 [Aquimonas sp.]|nr:hypothetical protein [Aquimonas sp.]